jgi:uncharacterized spore protein YtfJ
MFKESMDTLADHLEKLINTRTVVGEPTTTGNITFIPIITATFGFGAGGGEGTDPQSKMGGKGNGGGVGGKLTPSALIVIKGDDAQVYSLGSKGTLEKLIELAPDLASKFNFCKPKDED